MWILFSPSEKKCLECKKAYQAKKETFYQNFICNIGLDEALKAYIRVLQCGKESEIKQMFGVRNIDLEELAVAQNLMQSPLLPAVLRYIGVAFSALDFEHLESYARDYLNEHLLIFSNLFGLLRAEDKIPYYDLKQGEGFKDTNLTFSTKQLYAKNSENIWKFLLQNYPTDTKRQNKESLEILDLRAGFYQKCFDLSKIPTALKINELLVYEPNFIKNGKVVSHYAKHYRGVLLRMCAKEELKCLQDLSSLYIEGLELESMQTIQDKKMKRIVLTYALNCK